MTFVAVFASSSDPTVLLERVEQAVRSGAIPGWDLVSGCLRHTAPLASSLQPGFFKPSATDTAVKFRLLAEKGASELTRSSYAYHHGKLTEMLLAHFSEGVTRVQSTPFGG